MSDIKRKAPRASLHLGQQRHTPIKRDRSTINKRPSLARQEQTRPRRIRRCPDPPQRIRLPHRVLPDAIHQRLQHLTRKRPAGERVARDPPRRERDGQMPAQMMQPGLGRAVRVVLHDGNPQGVDGPYVDYPARVDDGVPLLHRGGLQQRDEELRQREDPLQVEGQDFRPTGVRVGVEGGAPGGAAVVDEDVQLLLPGGDGVGEAPALGLLAQVGGDRDGAAARGEGGGEGVQLGGGFIAVRGGAGGDVDFCAGGDEALRYHAPDAFAAAGY